ncbi:MAG TPA: hypothetical protein VFZ61_29740, partial [Polyangiales bacterium]
MRVGTAVDRRSDGQSTALSWLIGAALCACSDPAPQPAQDWPLLKLRVPSVSCLPPVEQRGDCGRDADCEAHQRCGLDPSGQPEDREPVTLACAAPRGPGEARSPCETGDQCTSGLCSLGGACLAPCREDDDCPLGQACQPVESR